MKKFHCFFIVLFSFLLYSQTIRGTIKDKETNTVFFVSILIKENSNPKQIIEFTNSKNGNYSIILKKKYSTILIEAQSSDFETKNFIIENPKQDDVYTIDFILDKVKTREIEEVRIISNKKPFKIKEDTISYNVESYKSPTDRKVQDVLKKLPGLDVNEKSGEIRYKGKPIETVMLDGDNLFGYNYSIGTKNINIDMIEQIEAIENYSENPLLKGIEGGEKVAINLKLKKEKTDYSGTIDFGLGINNKKEMLNNSNATILGISKKYKSFGIFSFNNIGINLSPFDYFSNSRSAEQIKEKVFTSQKVIPESLFNNFIDDDRSNINNNLFTNYNILFKINKRISLKTNLYYLQDNIIFEQSNHTENIIGSEIIKTSDYYNTTKKPQLYRGDFEIKFSTSKNSLLEYDTKFSFEQIKTKSDITENQSENFTSNLLTESIFFNQKLTFTNKISENKALQAKINHFYSSIPQNLSFNTFTDYNIDFQESNFKKKYFNALVSYLENKSSNKSSISIGIDYKKTPYTSTNNNGRNLTELTEKSIYALGSKNYTTSNWTLIPSVSLKIFNQNLEEKTNESFLFEPSLLVRYKINSVSFISSKMSYNQNPFSEEYIFSNPVAINNRILLSNLPSLEIKKSQVFNLSYYNNNLYKQFFINISANYQKNDSDFFSDYLINQNQIILNNFYLKEENDNLSFNLTTEKFINFISSTVNLGTNISFSNYKNIVNNSELRNNNSQNFHNTISIRTGFNSKINFENELSFNYFLNKTENINSTQNKTLTNNLRIKYNISENIFLNISGDYFLPSLSNKNNDYLFLDFNLIYKPKNKKYVLNVFAKNLLNSKSFSQIQTNDFSKSILTNNLIPRYILFNLTYNL